MGIEYYEGELKDAVIEALESQLDTLKATDEIHAVKWFMEALTPKARKELLNNYKRELRDCYNHFCKHI